MAEYWPSSFCVFDLTLTPTHKNAKTKNKNKKKTTSKQGEYPAILTKHTIYHSFKLFRRF